MPIYSPGRLKKPTADQCCHGGSWATRCLLKAGTGIVFWLGSVDSFGKGLPHWSRCTAWRSVSTVAQLTASFTLNMQSWPCNYTFLTCSDGCSDRRVAETGTMPMPCSESWGRILARKAAGASQAFKPDALGHMNTKSCFWKQPRDASNCQYFPSNNHCAWGTPHRGKGGGMGRSNDDTPAFFWNVCFEKHCRSHVRPACYPRSGYLSVFTCQFGLPWKAWCGLAVRTFLQKKQCGGTAEVDNISWCFALRETTLLFTAGTFERSRVTWLNVLAVNLLSFFLEEAKTTLGLLEV